MMIINKSPPITGNASMRRPSTVRVLISAIDQVGATDYLRGLTAYDCQLCLPPSTAKPSAPATVVTPATDPLGRNWLNKRRPK